MQLWLLSTSSGPNPQILQEIPFHSGEGKAL